MSPRSFSYTLVLLLIGASAYAQSQQLQGIGVKFGLTTDIKPTWPVVTEIVPNSPASNTSLKAGDWLLSVNNVSLEGKSLEDVAALIRGPEGSTITLKSRGYGEPPKTFTIKRAKFVAPIQQNTSPAENKPSSPAPKPQQLSSDFETACRQWAASTTSDGFKKLKEYYTPFCYTPTILMENFGYKDLYVAICVPTSSAYEVNGTIRSKSGGTYVFKKDKSFGGITSYTCHYPAEGNGVFGIEPHIKDIDGHGCEKLYVVLFTK